jgi:hypothetical protein
VVALEAHAAAAGERDREQVRLLRSEDVAACLDFEREGLGLAVEVDVRDRAHLFILGRVERRLLIGRIR